MDGLSIADPTVALGAKAPSGNDVVAPLTAFANMQLAGSRAQEVGMQARQQNAVFGARQSYLSMVNSGATPEDAIVKSGLSAIDPAGANQALQDVQQQRTLGAYRNYDPNNPNTLAAAGPQAVGQGATALQTQTNVQSTRNTLMAQHGNAFLANPTPDNWNAQVQSAANAGLISPLQAQQAWGKPDINVAKSWAALGQTPTEYATTSGAAAYNQGQAKAATEVQKTAPGETLTAPPAAASAMKGGWQPPGSQGVVPTAPAAQAAAAPAAAVTPMMSAAATKYGVSPAYLARTAQIESGGNPNATNPSGAAGLYQFMPTTAKQYGINPLDPVQATDGAARLAADNQAYLTKTLGQAPTDAQLYLAHQQGAAGAAKLLANPNVRAGDLVGDQAIIQNGGNPNAPASQFTQLWENKFNRSAPTSTGNFSVEGPMSNGPAAGPTVSNGLPSEGIAAVPLSPAAAPIARPQQAVVPPVPQPNGNASSVSQSAPVATAPAASTSPSGMTTITPGLTLTQKAYQEGMGQEAVKQTAAAREGYMQADTAQRSLLQLQDDISKLSGNGGFNPYQPGPGAADRLGWAKAFNTVLQTAGLPAMFDQGKIAAAESSEKITGRLGFDLAKTLGAREPGMIVQQAIKLNPGIENSPAGAKLLISSISAGLQRQKDFYQFQQQYTAQHGSPLGAEIAFDQSHPVHGYVQDAQNLSHIPQSAISYLQANPNAASQFDAKYGDGTSRYYIGGTTQ